MNKVISLLLVVVMVLGCISLVACGGGGGGGGGGGATTPPGGGTTPPGEEETTPSGEEESLGDILGLGAGITVKYDMVMTAPGTPTMTQHWWVKQNKVRTEMTQGGQTMISLIDYDAQTMYVYMPEENMAYKMAFNPTTQSAVEEAQSITDYDYDVIGTETLDGKVCLVVEYTYEQVTVKAWIWKEHGFPIREEMTTTEGKTVVEFKNIEFGDIPDDMFELPAGVQIIEMG
jgi:outer membrane lipoprotein-sorting protein